MCCWSMRRSGGRRLRRGYRRRASWSAGLGALSCVSLCADADACACACACACAECLSPCPAEGVRKVFGNKLVPCVQMLYWFTQSDSSQTQRTMAAVWYKLPKINSINSSKLLCETLITGILEAHVRRQRCRRAQAAGCLDYTWLQAKAT